MSESAVDIKVRAHVEIGEMRKIEDALQREIVHLRLAGNEADKLAAKEKHLGEIRQKIAAVKPGRKWAAALGGVAESIPGVSSFYTALNGSMLGIAALGYGVSKAFAVAGQSIRAFAASEVEMAKLDASLANSGQLTDEYRKKLEKLASKRSQKTAIDDEKYLGVFTTLTKFGADSSNIEGYTRAVENLAGFMGGDLEQAAFIFGKAMSGSTEMLGRFGIEVDKSKSQSEQLADIMRQLEARGGGQLEAMAEGMQGAMQKMANAWENMLESLGSLAEKSGLAKFLNWAAEKTQAAADFYAGESGSKQENRLVAAGRTPEAQAKAEELAAKQAELQRQREAMEASLAGMQEERDSLSRPMMAAAAGMAGVRVPEEEGMRQARLAGLAEVEGDIARAQSTLETIGMTQQALERQAAEAGVEWVSQAEADEMARIRALRQGEGVLGPAGDEGAVASAASAAGKRQELELELRLAEAKAAGNEQEARRLEWVREYAKLLREAQASGMGDGAWDFARRGADAGDAATGGKPPKPPVEALAKDVFSSMRAIGGARGESYSVQDRLLVEARKASGFLQRLSEKPPVVVDTKARFS